MMSDDRAEFQIRDRLTFIRFLGLGPGDAVPDAKTIWQKREHLTRQVPSRRCSLGSTRCFGTRATWRCPGIFWMRA